LIRSLSSLSTEERLLLQKRVQGSQLPLRAICALSEEEHAAWLIQLWAEQETDVVQLDGQTAILQFLPWDTDQLGIRSARLHVFGNAEIVMGKDDEDLIRLAKLVAEWAKHNGVSFVDTKVSAEHLYRARFLEQVGFHVVDTLVTMGSTPSNHASEPAELTIREALAEDLVHLEALSRDAFGDLTVIQDRFFLEPKINHVRAQELFVSWIRNSCQKHVAGTGVVLVAVEGQKLLGYLAMERLDASAFPGCWYDSLNAIDVQARGKGVYKALTRAAFARAHSEQARWLITKTQISNRRVINSWLHAGASLLESHVTLHWTS
jgi:GNAT superfamily N-acetyltransferase